MHNKCSQLTMSTQQMFTICNICTTNVHSLQCLHNKCPQYVMSTQQMSTICNLYIQQMFTVCNVYTTNVHSIQCLHNTVLTMQHFKTQCTLITILPMILLCQVFFFFNLFFNFPDWLFTAFNKQ